MPQPRLALVRALAGREDRDPDDLLVWIAELLLDMDAHIFTTLVHIGRRLDQMAIDETKFAADLTQMASDITEVKTGVTDLLAKGDTATQAEVDSLTAKLDTTAAALRDAASSFDVAAPAPAPAPTPGA